MLEDLTKMDIDEIVLVGGSNRILKVQQMVKEFVNEQESCKGMNPEEAVAYRALSRPEFCPKSKTPEILSGSA